MKTFATQNHYKLCRRIIQRLGFFSTISFQILLSKKQNKTNFDYIFQARSRSSSTSQPTVIEKNKIQTNKQCNYDRRSLCQQRGVTLYSYQVRPLCAKTNKQTLNCNCSSVKHWFRYVISFFSTPGPPFKKAHAQQLPSLVLNRLLNQTSNACLNRVVAPRTRPTGTPFDVHVMGARTLFTMLTMVNHKRARILPTLDKTDILIML